MESTKRSKRKFIYVNIHTGKEYTMRVSKTHGCVLDRIGGSEIICDVTHCYMKENFIKEEVV